MPEQLPSLAGGPSVNEVRVLTSLRIEWFCLGACYLFGLRWKRIGESQLGG